MSLSFDFPELIIKFRPNNLYSCCLLYLCFEYDYSKVDERNRIRDLVAQLPDTIQEDLLKTEEYYAETLRHYNYCEFDCERTKKKYIDGLRGKDLE